MEQQVAQSKPVVPQLDRGQVLAASPRVTIDAPEVDGSISLRGARLREALQTAASDNGWTLAGTIDIRFEVDPSRRPGVPAAVFPEARATGLALVRTDTGERIVLGDGTVTIGRSSASTIAVDDTRVSRSHATIERTRSGWSLTDAGSSNGTTVDGRSLTPRKPRPLAAGEVIGVGPVELRVEADGGAAPSGTRALADRDRTRISGEVLPPPRRPRS